jgi:hypothetical protein
MKSNCLMNKAGSFLLGGVNGLLFGSVVELLRRSYTPAYLERYIQREAADSPTGNIGYVFSCVGDDLPVPISGIPVMCMAVFAVIALLAHIFRNEWPRSPVLRWEVVGIISMTAAVALHNVVASPCHHTYLLSPINRWALCLPLVAGINLVYGLFVTASVDVMASGQKATRPR